jgi:hypothetical protein
MASESVGKNQSRRGTSQFVRQGHTESTYGSEINQTAKGQAGKPPKELKP